MPHYLMMSRRKIHVASLASQLAFMAVKVAYFEKRSTTTMMVPNSFEFDRHVMKSIVSLSQGFLAMGNGSSSPPGAFVSPCLVDK